MLSYPIYADQVPRARRCEQLGLAVPLVDTRLAPVQRDEVLAALSRIQDHQVEYFNQLERMREAMLDLIKSRPRIIAQITDLSNI